jgi:hypothetical protein
MSDMKLVAPPVPSLILQAEQAMPRRRGSAFERREAAVAEG